MAFRIIIAWIAACFICLLTSEASAASNASGFVHVAGAGPAEPGSFAAKYGAPMCDERAASGHAADPIPTLLDSRDVGEVNQLIEPNPVNRGSLSMQVVRALCAKLHLSRHALVKAHSSQLDFEPESLSGSENENQLTFSSNPAQGELEALLPGAATHWTDGTLINASLGTAYRGRALDEHRESDFPPPKPVPWKQSSFQRL